MSVESTKSLVRPIITISLVWAFIAACFYNTEAIAQLETLTTATVAFWFGGRVKGGSNAS